ncbi:MAG: TIGR03088 family PEP-CTERM/XrtA system glycosyltransferase [Gammaproteobacteria bacterium]|nr:TIGR03088 family PEP-CTERM/XrtA system glycosyltransferase [Gammaproteobacteria bacterium]
MADTPLIAHIIHRFDVGGLENGLVNLLNRIPPERYRHAIICMTDYSEFKKRLTNPAVAVYAINKRDGKDFGAYVRLWRLLRQLRPAIVHTRNLSALEGVVVAALAGVPARVHGEHGRDIHDIDGRNRKYLALRRCCQFFVQRYIPLSQDLERWLRELVGVPDAKIRQIYNGVDIERFHPANGREPLARHRFASEDCIVIGTVGRLEQVKDQLTLVRAFAEISQRCPQLAPGLRLVLVGDGSSRIKLEQLAAELAVNDRLWITGARDDVPELMRGMDIFVLPSLAEGISNTILEAMATGLPVVATRVGGNPELVSDGNTGCLISADDPVAMATALQAYIESPVLRIKHGQAGRRRVVEEFSMAAMVTRYLAVYDELMVRSPVARVA